MWDVLLDAFLDTLKLSLVLLIFYILIEVIEQKVATGMRRQLKSKYAVAVGAGFGIVPQCGFSVLASDLYSKRQISVGALVAVFIATSDEALPILLSSIHEHGVWIKLLALIAAKLVLALAAGYVLDLLAGLAAKRRSRVDETADQKGKANLDCSVEQESCVVTAAVVQRDIDGHTHGHSHEEEHGESHCDDNQADSDEDIHKGCCGHHIDDGKESRVKKYLVHPLLHTLKILAYILIINVVMGIVIYYVGEEKIADFMNASGIFQPILVTIVGLIPNCASSVLITELFLNGTISFGSCLGGLIVNAGLGMAFLFKENKNVKQNFAIAGGLFVFAALVAIASHYAFAGLI